MEKRVMLLSMHYRNIDKIFAGSKSVDVRRRRPRAALPIEALLYAPLHGVTGSVIISSAHHAQTAALPLWAATDDELHGHHSAIAEKAGFSPDEYERLIHGASRPTILVMEAGRRFIQPVGLAVLRRVGLEPAQSWRYLSIREASWIIEMGRGLC